jgi:hypothetical protein
MKKLTLTEYKSYLSSKSKDLLLLELLILYKKLPAVKDYYALLLGDSDDAIEKYKKIIRKEFVESDANPYPKSRFALAKQCLNDFKKVSPDKILILDLTLFYAECIADFNNTFGPDDESYYVKSEVLYEKVMKDAKSQGHLEYFHDRAYDMAHFATDGWGFSDQLMCIYNTYYDDKS